MKITINLQYTKYAKRPINNNHLPVITKNI